MVDPTFQAIINEAVEVALRRFAELPHVHQEWFSAKDAALYCGFSVKTLDNWRDAGKGPRYFKIGDSGPSPVRYNRADLDAFIRGETQ